jgi:hypothetical protein
MRTDPRSAASAMAGSAPSHHNPGPDPATTPPRLGARLWATFSFGPAPPPPLDLEAVRVDRREDRYLVDDVVTVTGAPLPSVGPGWHATRIEGRVPAPAPGATQALFATTQHLGYTSAEQQAQLGRISRQAPGGVVVVIPITKSEAWWALPQDRRQEHFAPSSPERALGGVRGHTVIGVDYADKIFRRLYHARYLPESEWDFVTYFEMDAENVPDFRRLLAELRDPVRNPEWNYVVREVEIWMRRR